MVEQSRESWMTEMTVDREGNGRSRGRVLSEVNFPVLGEEWDGLCAENNYI